MYSEKQKLRKQCMNKKRISINVYTLQNVNKQKF